MNCKNKGPTIIAAVGLAALFVLPSLVTAQSLGSASTFAVLAGSTVTNTGPTTIVGSVGVSPGTSITGLPLGQPTGGTIHEGDGVALQAQSDLTIAYNSLAGMACDSILTGQDLGGMTLAPGVYCFNTSAQLTGTLTLDGQGDGNAVFVIQIGSTLTTGTSAAVNLIGGAQPGNVYWQVGSSASLGTGTLFAGNIVALESITLVSGASLAGRALARTGAVTMDTNAIVGGTFTAVREVSWGMVKLLYR
jgi:type VI secretion system secreted protein VgrG